MTAGLVKRIQYRSNGIQLRWVGEFFLTPIASSSFVRFPGLNPACDPTCSLHMSQVRTAFGEWWEGEFRLEDGKRGGVVGVMARVVCVDRSFRLTQALLSFVFPRPTTRKEKGVRDRAKPSGKFLEMGSRHEIATEASHWPVKGLLRRPNRQRTPDI
jgi:hypothetical protein